MVTPDHQRKRKAKCASSSLDTLVELPHRRCRCQPPRQVKLTYKRKECCENPPRRHPARQRSTSKCAESVKRTDAHGDLTRAAGTCADPAHQSPLRRLKGPVCGSEPMAKAALPRTGEGILLGLFLRGLGLLPPLCTTGCAGREQPATLRPMLDPEGGRTRDPPDRFFRLSGNRGEGTLLLTGHVVGEATPDHEAPTTFRSPSLEPRVRLGLLLGTEAAAAAAVAREAAVVTAPTGGAL